MRRIPFTKCFEDISKDVTKIPKDDYLPRGKCPVIDQGSDFIGGYTNQEDGLFTDVPIVLFGDHTRRFKYVDFPFFAGADGVKILRAKKETDTHFGYYALTNLPLRSLGYSRHYKLLKAQTLPDIPLPEQKRIAGVLGAIDEKIEVNRAKINSLSLLAQSIYDYWFVQFDFPNENGKPYKSSNGKLAFNPTLKRYIPANWKVGNLYDIADYINGLACQKYRPQKGEKALPVIKITEMHEGITEKTEQVSVNIPDAHKIKDGDLLFSWSASLEVMLWCGGEGGLNQHIFKVVPKDGFPRGYVYHQLLAYVGNFVKIANARKTTMGHITSDHIAQSRIFLPPKPVLETFAKVIEPILEKQVLLREEVRSLEEMRDELLPLLMNGQLQILTTK